MTLDCETVNVELTNNDAKALAKLCLFRQRKIHVQRETRAKKNGGYFQPEEGRADRDLVGMEWWHDLAGWLIKDIALERFKPGTKLHERKREDE